MDTNTRTFRPNFLQKLANALAAFSGIPFIGAFLALPFIVSDSDEVFDRIELVLEIITIVAILAWAIVWQLKDRKSRKKSIPFSNDKYWYFGQVLAKWLLAAILLFYAVSKLTGQQLTASNLWYGTELGRMNGFMLAWSFFGYSKVYSTFIAMGQIAGAFALLFRRTTRLGIIILLPILINIFIIDFTFKGLEDARKIIPVLLYILIFLLFCEFKQFKAFFWDNASIEATDFASPSLVGAKRKPLLKSLAFVLLLAFAVGGNWDSLLDHQDHSPIDGVWYCRSEQQYDDSLHQYKLLDNSLEFFADGKACIINELGKGKFFSLKADSSVVEILADSSGTGSTSTKNIKGRYFLITNDSLAIRGKRGSDSIIWAFKRKK
jgi:hypothetical protein